MKNKIKLTSRRKAVLKAVEDSVLPLNAEEIFKILKKKMDQATVYRSLSHLEKNNLLKGFTIFCSEEGAVRYYNRNTDGHLHYLHCENCHSFTKLPEICTFERTRKSIEEKYKFIVKSHTMYLSGTCAGCHAGHSE